MTSAASMRKRNGFVELSMLFPNFGPERGALEGAGTHKSLLFKGNAAQVQNCPSPSGCGGLGHLRRPIGSENPIYGLIRTDPPCLCRQNAHNRGHSPFSNRL